MKKPVSSLLSLLILSVFNQAYADVSQKAHHPIRYKPNVSPLFPSGYTPNQISNAYGFKAVSAKGKGQVIAIVDAFDHPRIENDLAIFNQEFGLPACTTKNACFKKIYATNKKPITDAGWAGEIALDVEWAHAMAPEARIMLVEAASDSIADLYQAVKVAIKNGATVVSMSWGGDEYSAERSVDTLLNNTQVSFVASSGDSGTGASYPAASPYVLAVGGTTLSTDSYGNYQGETAWEGSGGGISAFEPIPVHQKNLPLPQLTKRGIPDVAYNADPNTGFAVYNSIPGEGGSGWQVVGGTSAGAPQWAAFIAVLNSTWQKNIGNKINGKLYALANAKTGNYPHYFNDILEGDNGDCGFLCTAQSGYDYVTGLGSPQADKLIEDNVW